MSDHFGINNMNSTTNNKNKTCGLNDMNCLGEEEEEKTCGLNDMNCLNEEEGSVQICSLNDMNCMDENNEKEKTTPSITNMNNITKK